MPPAHTATQEPTIFVPLNFVHETYTFASQWIHDFHDYAEDISGDETEQAEREQELARIRYLAETSETLLLGPQPATEEQFQQWVQDLARFGTEIVIEPIPDDRTEPGATGFRVKLNTALFSYSIVAIWEHREQENTDGYMGAIAARHGNGGRDLADGPVTAETWHRILRDIVAMEMTAYQPPAADPDPQLADARAHRSFPSEVKATYAPNGDITVSLAGDTAHRVAQQAQAAQLTTAEYLQAKLGQPAGSQPAPVPPQSDDPDAPTEIGYYRLTLSPTQFQQAQTALADVGIPLTYSDEFELGSETETYASVGGVASIILPQLEEQLPSGKTLVSDIPVPELRNLMRHYANDPAWFARTETDVDDFIANFPNLVVDG